ncbi:FCD domain-containing protein [Caballeronia sp. dw_19]|uniref:GntR family transcriptional regulator n=1 Tax=Caballeronia sp. dw_19 TaxID=2719791 RepID=UPI001BD48E59|nr:FCD domain-containing protein [Caballeronia sp. dw_19]
MSEPMYTWGPALRHEQSGEPKTMTDAVVARLRKDIISGRFKPGQKIKSNDLREHYSVGISPLREALFQLVSEGLVRADSQRGFRVAEISVEELRDITQWRLQLEGEALRLAIEHGDVEWETSCLSAYHRLARAETDTAGDAQSRADNWEERHLQFHFALYSACGSPWLLRFCEILIEQGQRYRRNYVVYTDIAAHISDEHRQMIDAVIARRADDAVALLHLHIKGVESVAMSHFGVTEAPPA